MTTEVGATTQRFTAGYAANTRNAGTTTGARASGSASQTDAGFAADPATTGKVDRELLEKSGLPAPQAHLDRGPRAYVQRERESWAETSDPVKLPALMTRIERGN